MFAQIKPPVNKSNATMNHFYPMSRLGTYGFYADLNYVAGVQATLYHIVNNEIARLQWLKERKQ